MKELIFSFVATFSEIGSTKNGEKHCSTFYPRIYILTLYAKKTGLAIHKTVQLIIISPLITYMLECFPCSSQQQPPSRRIPLEEI